MEPIRFDEFGGWAAILLGFALLVQLYYLLGVFSKLAFHKPATGKVVSEPVSVIICAKDEAANIAKGWNLIYSKK